MTNDNYFSWANISKVAGIDAHVGYVSTLLGKNYWKADDRKRLGRQLDAILDKQRDQMLNISVIGEFATGKSSFINALVGCDLLAVDVLQGTTVAITVIEHADDFSITLTGNDGKSRRKTYRSFASLQRQLHVYTTDATYARQIASVTVGLPSETLRRGYRIIDTPGTNSLDLWHEDVTRRALSELSDLSIVVMDATRPMPQTLVAFLDSTLGTAARDCAFVVNRIDLVRQREQEALTEYVRRKASQAFDADEPMVVPFSALSLIRARQEGTVDAGDPAYALTTKSLRTLLDYTARQRMRAQAHKLLTLIDDTYSSLDAQLQTVAADYRQQLQLLERSRQADLRPFVESQTSKRQKAFLAKAKDRRMSIDTAVGHAAQKAQENIMAKIDALTDIDNLASYIKEKLAGDIAAEGRAIVRTSDAKQATLRNAFNNELREFQTDFRQQFQRLRILSVNFDAKPRDIAVRHHAATASIAPVTELITGELSRENWAFGGGAAAGATIGTLVAPGLGTVVGGVIGFFAGSIAAPNTLEVKAKVKEKLRLPLKRYFLDVAGDCMTNYTTYTADISHCIATELKRYATAYSATVAQRIKEWKAQHDGVSARIAQIENDIHAIAARQQSVRNFIAKL